MRCSPTCAYGPRPYAFSSAMSSSSRALTGLSSCSGSSTGGGIAAGTTGLAPVVCRCRRLTVKVNGCSYLVLSGRCALASVLRSLEA
jgi:hypothetical protein